MTFTNALSGTQVEEQAVFPPCVACDHCKRKDGVYVCERALLAFPAGVDPVTGDERKLTADRIEEITCERVRSGELCSYSHKWLESAYLSGLKRVAIANLLMLAFLIAALAASAWVIKDYRAGTDGLAALALCGLSLVGLLFVAVLLRPACEENLAAGRDGMPPLIERAAKAGFDLLPSSARGIKRRYCRAKLLSLSMEAGIYGLVWKNLQSVK